jgi:hypothetical protein
MVVMMMAVKVIADNGMVGGGVEGGDGGEGDN